MDTPRRRTLVLASAVALALTACSDGVNPGTPDPATASTTTAAPTPSASPTETTAPEETPAPTPTEPDGEDAPPFPATTSPDTAAPSAGAMLTVVDVRVGHHEGFDRVVYEMDGAGTPGWTVGYVDEAVQEGSGTVLDLAGEGTLSVMISGSAYPMDSGVEPFAHDGPVAGDGSGVVTQVLGWSVFEGYTDSFVGLTEPGHPFRVSLLEDPVRVVVDVATELG